MPSATLSIANGTPLGGQTVAVTGLSGLAVAPTVTIEGRAATVTAWTATSATIKTPARRDVNGLLVVGDDDVTLSVNGGAWTATYHYNSTRLDLALQAVRAQIAQISVDRGDYYTISPAQIQSFQVFQEDTGEAWPQGLVYAMPTDYSEDGQDSPHGFYTGKTHCVAQFMLPLDDRDDWDTQLRWLQADLFRAIMLTRESDSIANTYNVTTMFPGKVTGPQDGAMACATVEFDIELRTRNTNQNLVN